MGAGGQNGEAVFGGDFGDGLAQMAQLGARVRHVAMRRGVTSICDCRIRGASAPSVAALAASKKACGRRGDRLGLRVDQEIFFLDAEREIAAAIHHLRLARCMGRIEPVGMLDDAFRCRFNACGI